MVITSITAHIERGEKRVGIQQIAAENYLSTASIVKMCKRLGFDGYSELYYQPPARRLRKADGGDAPQPDRQLFRRPCQQLLRAAARTQKEKDFYDRRGLFQHCRLLHRSAFVDLRLYGLQRQRFFRSVCHFNVSGFRADDFVRVDELPCGYSLDG